MTTITVYNLSNDDKYYYVDLTPKQALEATWQYVNKHCNTWIYGLSTLKIIKGKHTLSIGDLCVLL